LKSLDWKSLVVAGLFGAALVAIAFSDEPEISLVSAAATGFLIGAGVQAGVRIVGVS
jgi:hypothetical protein